MYCPNCGKEIENNLRFCIYCGANIQESLSGHELRENRLNLHSRNPRLPQKEQSQQYSTPHEPLNLTSSIKYSDICFLLGLISLILSIIAFIFSIFTSFRVYLPIAIYSISIAHGILSIIYKNKSESIEGVSNERKMGSTFAIIGTIFNSFGLFLVILMF